VQIEYGIEVRDRNGCILGTVSNVIRDTWTGEIRKFVVLSKLPEKNLFFSPEDVLEVSSTQVKVKAEGDELNSDT